MQKTDLSQCLVRITTCLETQSPSIDLSGLGLSQLPEPFFKLYHLEKFF